MKGFLDYLPGSSVLHKMHPLVKIFVSILICAASFCSSNYYYLLEYRLVDYLQGDRDNNEVNICYSSKDKIISSIVLK